MSLQDVFLSRLKSFKLELPMKRLLLILIQAGNGNVTRVDKYQQ